MDENALNTYNSINEALTQVYNGPDSEFTREEIENTKKAIIAALSSDSFLNNSEVKNFLNDKKSDNLIKSMNDKLYSLFNKDSSNVNESIQFFKVIKYFLETIHNIGILIMKLANASNSALCIIAMIELIELKMGFSGTLIHSIAGDIMINSTTSLLSFLGLHATPLIIIFGLLALSFYSIFMNVKLPGYSSDEY